MTRTPLEENPALSECSIYWDVLLGTKKLLKRRNTPLLHVSSVFLGHVVWKVVTFIYAEDNILYLFEHNAEVKVTVIDVEGIPNPSKYSM